MARTYWRTVVLFASPRGDFRNIGGGGRSLVQQLSGAKRQRNIIGYQRNCLISRGTNVCRRISRRN